MNDTTRPFFESNGRQTQQLQAATGAVRRISRGAGGGSRPSNAVAEQAFEQAKERHIKNVSIFRTLIDDGAKQAKHAKSEEELRWANTCLWIKNQVHGSCHVVTETHDAPRRAAVLGNRKARAHFGSDAPYSEPSSYDFSNLKNRDNVDLIDRDVAGLRTAVAPFKLYFVEPTMNKTTEWIKNIAIHEVQHDADHTKLESEFHYYGTEFNARWVETRFNQYSTAAGSADDSLKTNNGIAAKGFSNRRAQMIFLDIYNARASYPYVVKLWQNPKTRQQIVALSSIQSPNALNSPALEAAYVALTKQPMDIADTKAKLKKLSKAERESILANPATAQLWRKAVDNVPDAKEQAKTHKKLKL